MQMRLDLGVAFPGMLRCELGLDVLNRVHCYSERQSVSAVLVLLQAGDFFHRDEY